MFKPEVQVSCSGILKLTEFDLVSVEGVGGRTVEDEDGGVVEMAMVRGYVEI